DSINWGVRWLYHKAQGSTTDNKRYWRTWREAVINYGPPKKEYVTSVWEIYKKGVKKDKKLGTVRLWLILLIMFLPFFSDGSYAYSLENIIKNQIINGQSEQLEAIELVYSQDKKYVLAQVESEEDWWEELKVGRINNSDINWFTIDKIPSEQAILSAKFIDLKGFNNPLVEVYGLTHVGHGFLYIYEIQNDSLKLLFETVAVDYNPDTRWAPGNFKKYGYSECGEIFSGGKLRSEYRDVNKDGFLGLILRGTQEIICDSEGGSNQVYDIKVSAIPVEKIFLWDNDKRIWNASSTK
ncbi:MAG: hypothetical protein AAB966_03470, partial [Patescibacteria group bacterium]